MPIKQIVIVVNCQRLNNKGYVCGLVGRAVASNSRGPWFEIYIKHLLSTVLKRRKIKDKTGREWPI